MHAKVKTSLSPGHLMKEKKKRASAIRMKEEWILKTVKRPNSPRLVITQYFGIHLKIP